MKKIIFFLCISNAFLLTNVHADLIGELSINGVETREVSKTDASEWRIRLMHPKTKELLTNFAQLHTRDMHLVIVKKDLSSFAHVHPVLIGKTGVFHTVLNQPSFDPDNTAAAHAIAGPGEYYVFTESSPKDHSDLSLVELSRMEITAPGAWNRELLKLDPLERGNGGGHNHGDGFEIVKFFNAEGLPDPKKPWKKPKEFRIIDGKFGDLYRTSLHVSQVAGCGGNMIQLHFSLSIWNQENATYETVRNLQNWLGMQGHAIFIEANERISTQALQFVHLHGMQHGDNSAVMFSHFDRKIMSGKNYRAWLQVKHDNNILTFPFTFHYMANYQTICK